MPPMPLFRKNAAPPPMVVIWINPCGEAEKTILASSSGIASLPGGGDVHQNAMVTGKPPFTTLRTGKSWKITMCKK